MKPPSENQIKRYIKRIARIEASRVWSVAQLCKFKMPNDPRVQIDKRHQTCTLFYTVAPYEVDLDRISSEADLLEWIYFLSKKPWLDKRNLREIIRRIAGVKGLDLRLGSAAAVRHQRQKVSEN